MISKEDLIAFELEVARRFELDEIKGPVHLSVNNEDALIEIFKDISPDDWKCCAWRNHYAALLSGIHPDELMRQIVAGRSMFINSAEHRFYASSIAGGILPIAVGLGMAIKRKNGSRKVWCFVGDMTGEMGIFYECQKYSKNFDLPVTFIIEDNGKSVLSDTKACWNGRDYTHPVSAWDNVIRYEYELTWPHSGVKQIAGF